jgi:asparagine synthase (glutamine-hydrolysing)
VDDARAVIEPALSAQGQPFGDPSLLPTYLVSRLAREKVTVVLSGDGADELFAGYRKHLVESRRAAFLRLPAAARAALSGLARLLPATRSHRLGEFVRQVRKFAAAAAAPADARWLALQSLLAPVERAHALYRAGILDSAPLARRVAELVAGPGEGLDGALRADFELVLPDRMLFKVDAASMAHGLEVRVPFLDRDVVHFVRACPADYKLKGGVRKRLLRDIGLPLLPPEMARRPKQGFDAPVGRWLAGPLREQFFDLVRGERSRTLLDVAAVESLYERHARGREAADAMLWSVFCLAHWAERASFAAP